MYSEFYNSFVDNYNAGKQRDANIALLNELGRLLAEQRDDFIFLMSESGIAVNAGMSDDEIIHHFIEHIGKNDDLALGTSILVSINNKKIGFDGEEVINDSSVKGVFRSIKENFSGADGLVGAISGAVKSVADATKQGLVNRGKKQHGLTDALVSKHQAKVEMQKQASKTKAIKAQAEAKAQAEKEKTTKVIVISVVGLVIVASTIAAVIYFKKKK